MSTVIYNGVKMELVKTNGVERIPIFSSDKTTYLYTQWTHDFVAVLNPAATAYDAAGNAAANQMPIVTDKAIRHKLAQGHATYEWYVGEAGVLADRVIRSPAPAAKTDMNNGPHPEVVSVVQVTGTHTWMIHMRITTWINECPQTPLILSHRWRVSHDVNEDQLSTRTVVGEAVFNPVRLASLAMYCDDFRIRLRHRVPAHFQRTAIHVVQGEDGTTVNYSFTDVERPMNINDRNSIGITNIEVTRSIACTSIHPWNAVISTAVAAGASIASSAISNAANIRHVGAEMSRSERARSGLTARPSGAQLAMGVVSGIAAGVAGAIPAIHNKMTVKVHGSRLSRKSQLLKVALQILATRTRNIVENKWPNVDLQASYDDVGKYVELQAIYSLGALSAIRAVGIAPIFGMTAYARPDVCVDPVPPDQPRNVSEVALRMLSQGPDHVIPFDINNPHQESFSTLGVHVSQELVHRNPEMPNSSGTRGTWVEKIVAASLSDPCSEPEEDGASIATPFGLSSDPIS